MCTVAALSTESASPETNPSRSAKATKFPKAPWYVRRVGSRTEISSRIYWTWDGALAFVDSPRSYGVHGSSNGPIVPLSHECRRVAEVGVDSVGVVARVLVVCCLLIVSALHVFSVQEVQDRLALLKSRARGAVCLMHIAGYPLYSQSDALGPVAHVVTSTLLSGVGPKLSASQCSPDTSSFSTHHWLV